MKTDWFAHFFLEFHSKIKRPADASNRGFGFLLAILALPVMFSCSRPQAEESSSITIDTKSFHKVGLLSSTLPPEDQSCFAVDVQGEGIPSASPQGQCSEVVGLFKGFVPAGQPLVVDVPRGPGRVFRVYLFRRNAGGACPGIEVMTQQQNQSKVYRIATSAAVTLEKEEETVELTASYPGDFSHIATNYPSSCSVPPATGVASVKNVSLVIGSGSISNSNGRVKVQIRTTGVAR